jgi:hypothetical protein
VKKSVSSRRKSRKNTGLMPSCRHIFYGLQISRPSVREAGRLQRTGGDDHEWKTCLGYGWVPSRVVVLGGDLRESPASLCDLGMPNLKRTAHLLPVESSRCIHSWSHSSGNSIIPVVNIKYRRCRSRPSFSGAIRQWLGIAEHQPKCTDARRYMVHDRREPVSPRSSGKVPIDIYTPSFDLTSQLRGLPPLIHVGEPIPG